MKSKKERLIEGLQNFPGESDSINDLIETLKDENSDPVDSLFTCLVSTIKNDQKEAFHYLLSNNIFTPKLFTKFVSHAQDGQTVLHFVATHKKYWAIEPLLECGARRRVKDNDGKSPYDLYKALNPLSEEDDISKSLNPHEEHIRMVEGLKKLCDQEDEDYKNKIYEFEFGTDHHVMQQIDRAIPLTRILIESMVKGNDALFNFLMDNEDVRTYYPQIVKERSLPGGISLRPLLVAIRMKNKAFVEKLIERGADFNELGKSGSTPLMSAISNGKNKNIEIIKLLLERGADVNIKGPNGDTALHYAALGDEDAVRVLLEAGADFRAVDSRNRTPHYRAREHAYVNTQTILMEKEELFDFSSMSQDEINECVGWDVYRVRKIFTKLDFSDLKSLQGLSKSNDDLIKKWMRNVNWVAKVDELVNLPLDELFNTLYQQAQESGDKKTQKFLISNTLVSESEADYSTEEKPKSSSEEASDVLEKSTQISQEGTQDSQEDTQDSHDGSDTQEVAIPTSPAMQKLVRHLENLKNENTRFKRDPRVKINAIQDFIDKFNTNSTLESKLSYVEMHLLRQTVFNDFPNPMLENRFSGLHKFRNIFFPRRHWNDVEKREHHLSNSTTEDILCEIRLELLDDIKKAEDVESEVIDDQSSGLH